MHIIDEGGESLWTIAYFPSMAMHLNDASFSAFGVLRLIDPE